MKNWENTWEISQEYRKVIREDKTFFYVNSFYVVDRVTREKLFSKTRGYGYSTKRDAERGATRRWNDIQIVFEKELLGQHEEA